MARAKTARADGETVELQTELTPEEQAALDLDEANEAEGGELFAALEEMRGTAGVQFIFTRVFPSTPDQAGYVGSLTPAEFSLERMTERYGPGIYRVRIRGPKGGWLKGGGTIKIAKGAEKPSGAPVNDVAAILREMNEREETRRKEMSDRRDRLMTLVLPAAITALPGILTGLFGNRGPDVTALITAMKPAPAPSIAELTTALANIRALSGNEKDESKLDQILKIFEVVKNFSGEGSGDKGESNWIDVVRDLLKEGPALVQPLLENLRAQQPAPAMPTMTVQPRSPLAMPSPAPMSEPSSAPTGSPSSPLAQSASVPPSPDSATGEPDMNLYLPLIRAQLAKLLQWAQEKRRVELYAEVLLEELPAVVHQFVTPEKALEYLDHTQWFEIVTNLDPRLQPFREWLDQMRREVIDIIKEQLREEPRFEPADSTLVDDTASTGTAE